MYNDNYLTNGYTTENLCPFSWLIAATVQQYCFWYDLFCKMQIKNYFEFEKKSKNN